MSYFDGLYLKKSRSACSCLGQNINLFFGPNWAQLGAPWWSTLRAASRSYWLFDFALPSEHENLSWIDWIIEISPSTRWVLLGRVPRAQVAFSSEPSRNLQPTVRDDPWHHIDPLCIRAFTSARAFAAATCCARPRARRRRSLNILTAREPMGLSSRRRLILLASHRMALTRERKNSSRIAREIEIFSIFAWLVPTLVPKHNSRFRVFRSTICWLWWSIKIYETFGLMKSLFPCGILFLHLAQKQVQIWGCRFSLIVGFRSPNFAPRNTLVYWNRINWHFGSWEKKFREMEFGPLGNENVPFCRTEWFRHSAERNGMVLYM